MNIPLSCAITECIETTEEEEEEEKIQVPSFTLAAGNAYNLKAGESQTINVRLQSVGQGSVSMVAAMLSSSDSDIIVEDIGEKTMASLSPSFSFRISAPETASAGVHNLTLSVNVFDKNGGAAGSYTYNIPVNVTSDVKASALTVKSYETSKKTISSGDKFKLTLTLENKCGIDLQNIEVSLAGLDSTKFVLDGGFSKQTVSIKDGKTGKVTFPLVACDGIAAVRESIGVQASYCINPENPSSQNSLETSVIITCAPEIKDSGKYDLTMTEYKVSSSSVADGTRFKLTVTLENSGKEKIEKARLSLLGLDGGKFAVNSGLTYVDFDIDSGKSKTFSFDLLGCGGISSVREVISLLIEYGQVSTEADVTVSCKPAAEKETAGKHDLTMTDYEVSSSAVAEGTRFTLSLTLENSSSKKIDKARLSVLGLDGTKFAVNSGLTYTDFDIEAGEKKTISFSLLGCKGITSVREVIPVLIEYGDVSSEVSATISCAPSAAADGDVFAPNIIIESYDFGGSFVTAGQTFPLKVVVKNTSSEAVVENLKITVRGGSNNLDGSIAFSPANSSNSFFIEALPLKSSSEIALDLLAKADAAPNSYPVEISFAYEYSAGSKRYQAAPVTETITIPLQQEDRLTVNDPEYPNYAVGVGEMCYISTSLVNKGKSGVYNVSASVEGEGFDISTPVYYIGNINSGSEEYYDVQITPNTEGEINGAIVITYEDANGTAKEQRKPFSFTAVTFNYEEMYGMDMGITDMPVDEGMGGEMPAKSGGGFIAALIIGVVVVIAVVVIIIIVVKKKKRKKELEDDDEDI